MPNLPGANLTVDAAAGAVAQGTDLVCVLAPVPTNADATPRQYGTAAAVYAQHGYSEGVEYCALHAREAAKPFVFVGLPIVTPGAIGRQNILDAGVSLAAGGSGVLQEHDGVLRCVTGGVVGTDQIVLSLSLDGERTTKTVRLGTAASYTIPYVGVTISFSGTLAAGLLAEWHGTGPRANTAGVTAAFAALAAGQRMFRTVLLIGDLQSDTEAAGFLTELEAYETANKRFVSGRANVYDRFPLATLGAPTYRMTGAPTLTFAEVEETGDTITRSAGSFIADGFQAGDLINVTGSASNNITAAAVLANVEALALTLGTDDLVNEGPKAGCTIIGHEALTFAAAADTVTRSRGSWLDDGFREGDTVTIAGTVSNNGTFTAAAVTDSVLDLGDGLVDEVIRADTPTISVGQTKAAWMAEIDAEFATIDDAPRIALCAGRARKLSAFSGWYLRQPRSWIVSLREYSKELHVAPWRKEDGPTGWDLYDADGTLAEWDDRVDGSAGTAARFTVGRTWGNGPAGDFIAMGLSRATDSSVLLLTHNQAVVDVACQVGQAAAENFVGRSLVLNSDGTATRASLARCKKEVDEALERALLQNFKNEGPRCSAAYCTLSTTDILTGAEAHLTGTITINLNGTIHTVDFTVAVK